ncbi:MAG: hypothetical protein CM1200mP27_08130 [Chloroflexota bacterium]|nr:MAG: hypothetical protein CM1200mP27_08130 [Chloroflexota bacterium]
MIHPLQSNKLRSWYPSEAAFDAGKNPSRSPQYNINGMTARQQRFHPISTHWAIVAAINASGSLSKSRSRRPIP